MINVLIKKHSIKIKDQLVLLKVDIKRIVLSKKNLRGKKGSFKYFIGYINGTDSFPILLCIKFLQMNQ